jgi:hypothetical protein
MSRHFQNHRATRTTGGGCHVPLQHLYENGSPIFTHVYCQRFFATGAQSSYFEITPGPGGNDVISHPILRRRVLQLDARGSRSSSRVVEGLHGREC